MSSRELDRLRRRLVEAREIIEQEHHPDPYPEAFGYLEEAVASYLDLPVRHHGRSPSPPSPGEVR